MEGEKMIQYRSSALRVLTSILEATTSLTFSHSFRGIQLDSSASPLPTLLWIPVHRLFVRAIVDEHCSPPDRSPSIFHVFRRSG
ncbi:hypothetical protein CEXT_299751 [Caerostris extrusa]|uniref:Uncharacterized protein n=1 Tax=Caerostris extrusa TaxID=172846 RepID=A0AAV4V699_CAEEX|nr:hypothetical protein CEXT_299751 [Caerostris extrusa]